MIQGLWDRQVNAIIDVKLSDDDEDTYKYDPTKAILTRLGKIKKDKHSKHCHN